MLHENIKFLRQQQKLSQAELADQLGLTRTSLSGYEIGKIEPNLEILNKLSTHFKISLDELINSDVSKTKRSDAAKNSFRVLAITVDKEEKENIEFVPVKARAGYLEGYGDPTYVKELFRFNLPNRPLGTYRAFEISGDSMLPIGNGSIIISRYVENWQDIKNNFTYILVTQTEGVVYKRVINNIQKNGTLKLISDNPIYQPYDIPIEEIREAWGYYAHISFNHPDSSITFDHLVHTVKDLQEEVEGLKRIKFSKVNNFKRTNKLS